MMTNRRQVLAKRQDDFFRKKSSYNNKKTRKENRSQKPEKQVMNPFVFWVCFGIIIIGLFAINLPQIELTLQKSFGGNEPNNEESSQSETLSMDSANTFTQKQQSQRDFSYIEDDYFDYDEYEEVRELTPSHLEMLHRLYAMEVDPQPSAQIAAAAQIAPSASPSPATQVAARAQMTTMMTDRALYFIEINDSGQPLRSSVKRHVPVSDSPLRDTLELLFRGPTDEEREAGIVSLIPQGTRLLSVQITDSTAHINISDDFEYNIYGIEGYSAQVAQIVRTATEFANIDSVQILIGGRKTDYLGEGVWIGSPVNRDMF